MRRTSISRKNASRRWQKAACGPHGCTTRRRPYLYVRVGVLVSENRRSGAYTIDVSFEKYLRDGVSDQNGFAVGLD